MNEEEKKAFVERLSAAGAQIGQVNFGDGHQYFGCTIQQPISEQPLTQPIEAEVVTEDNIKLFKYISPFITDEKERREIHKVIVNLVNSDFRLSAICAQLKEFIKQKKIALYVSTAEQYNELVRLGLPANKEGYSQKNYENYMSEQKK